MNSLGLVLNLFSAVQRAKKRRGKGIFLSTISSSILLLSAWLGGELAYKYKVGINKIPQEPEGNQWLPAMSDADLPEMTARRVEVDGSPILIYRYQGQVYAIGAVCGHEGAPLEEGSFEGHCVTCPWHQSVYDLRDGSVVHGPTTYAEPSFDVRVLNGTIELRLREKPANVEASRMIEQGIEQGRLAAAQK